MLDEDKRMTKKDLRKIFQEDLQEMRVSWSSCVHKVAGDWNR